MEYFVYDEDKIDDFLLKKLKESSCSAYIVIHLTPTPIMNVVINKNKPTDVVDPKTFYSEATQFKFPNYDSAYLATQRLI